MPFLIVQMYNGSQSALKGRVLRMKRRISTAGFFFFKVVLQFSIAMRLYSSLPTLQGRAAVREYRHDKNTAYSGSLDARRNKQQQIGLTIIRTICCLYNLLSWLSVVKTIYRQNNLSIKLSIDSSTYRFVELSNCRKNNCYVIKGKNRHLFSLPQSYHLIQNIRVFLRRLQIW